MRMEKNLVLKKKGVTNEKFEVDTSDIDSNGADVGDVLTADGSGGASWEEIVIPAPIIDVTYAELVALISAGDLVAGQQYRITDYATRHYILYYDQDEGEYVNTLDTVTGVTEPLICLAVGIDKIHAEVKSELYPEDIIHYDWNPDNWINDLSFGYDDGGGTLIISGFKGVIISRHDTLRQLNAPSDWRNCLTRRWETDANAWDSGTSYSIGDIVSHAGTNMVYKSLQDANLNNEPMSGDNEYWIVMLELSAYTYWNASPTSWNHVPSGVAYDDFLLFNDNCESIDIERTTQFYWEYEGEYIPPTFILNSVFFGMAFTNEIGYRFAYNTIGTEFSGNTIGAEFSGNTIGTEFRGNTIGAYFEENTIGAEFRGNTIGAEFSGNTIGAEFSGNTIGAYFGGNTIGAYFGGNTIGAYFGGNTIGAGFGGNTIGVGFSANTIGAGFSGNTIGAYFGGNTIGAGFKRNEVADKAIESVDFTGASHVYAEYNCYLYKRPDGTAKLRYYDNSDVQQIVLPTA